MPLSATSTGAGAGGFAAPSNSNHKPSPPPVSILTSTVSSSLTTSPTHHHHHQQPQQLPQHPPSPLAQPQQQQSTASILGAAQSFSLVSVDSMVAAAAAVAALHENNHHDSSATATRVSTTTAALAHSLLQPVAGGIIFNHNNTVEVPTPLSGANGSSNSMSNPTSGSQQRGVGRGSISTSSSGSAVYAPRFGSGVGLGGGVASTPLRSAGGAATAALPADIRQSLASLQYTIQCRASEVHEQLHSMAQLLETLMTTSDTNPQLHGTGGGGGGRGSSASSHKSSAEQESLHGSPHQQEPQKPQQQQRRGFSPGGGGAASSSPPITPNHNLTHVNPPPLMPVRVDGEAPSPPRVPHQPIAASSSSVPGASSSQDGGNDAQRSASPRGRHLATFSPSLKPLQPVVSPQEAVKVPSPPPLPPPSATTLGGGGEVDVKSPIRTVYANVAVTSVEAGRGGLDAAAVTEQTEKLRTVRPPAALVMSSSSSGSGNHPQANSNNSSNHNLGGAVTSTGQRLAAPLALRSPHHSLYSDAHNHTATANRALLAHLQLQLVDFVNAETAYQQALQGMIKSHERILVNATSSAVAAFGATAAMSGTTSLMMATSNTGSSSSPASPFLLQSPPAAAAAAAVAVATDQRNAGQSASSISATSYCSHNGGDDAKEYLSRMMQLQQQQPAATPTTTPPHKDESVTTPSQQQQQQRAPMTSFAPVTASYQPTLPSPPKRSHRSTSDRNLKHATGGGALVPIDDDDDGPNQITDAALLVTEGTSLTMPHNYNTHYTQNNNEASIELGFIPEDEDLYLLPSSSQPSASMIAHHQQQQQQDMLTSISGGLFEALDHLRGMNHRAAVQLGSFRRRSRGPAAAMLQPSSSHQRSTHHQIGAGGVALMMDFVDDDGELMECEQSIDVGSPALGLGEDAAQQQQQLRRTASGRAALVQSAVSVFSDQHSAGTFEHPVPASAGGQFWQRRGGGGAGARRSRTSPSSSHGHRRTASKEDITFPLYVYANIQTAKKAESGEEEDDDEYGVDAARAGPATEATSDFAREAATEAMTTAARASSSRHRPPLPIISPGFASPLAPGTSASAASYPTSTPVENALLSADDAASPMPHPPPPPPPPVSIAAEGSSHHSRLHHHAEPHSCTVVGSGAPVWHNRLQVNAVATSLSLQRSSLSGELPRGAPGGGNPLGQFPPSFARNAFGSMSSGESSSTAHGQHHGATTNAAAAGGGSDASRSLTNPSVSFEYANFLSVALMSDAVNQSTETSAAAAVVATTAGTTTVLPPPTATIQPPEAPPSSEQQQQRRRSTRAHQDNGNNDDGLIGPLVPTVSSSYQLLRASHVADSGSVSVLPFDARACGSGMTARPSSASSSAASSSTGRGGGSHSSNSARPALVEVPSQELEEEEGGDPTSPLPQMIITRGMSSSAMAVKSSASSSDPVSPVLLRNVGSGGGGAPCTTVTMDVSTFELIRSSSSNCQSSANEEHIY